MFPPALPLHALPADSLFPVRPVTLQRSMGPSPCAPSGPPGFDPVLSALTQQGTGAPRGVDFGMSSHPWGRWAVEGQPALAPIAHRSVARWRELVCLHLARWLPFGGLGSDAFSTPQPFRSRRPQSPRQLAWGAEHSCQSGPRGASPGGTWGSNSMSTDLAFLTQLMKVTNKPVSQVSELLVWSITRYSCCFDPVMKGFFLSVASRLALKCTLSAVRAAQLLGGKS